MGVLTGLAAIVFTAFLQCLASPLFWVVVLLVGFLHRRQIAMKQNLFGTEGESPWNTTLISMLFGLAGGLFGSYLMVLLGISITEIGIGYLWLIAIALMLINPRYLCFSYAGGLLSLFSLLFGFPSVDVPQLMGLVAVLHMVESLLILLSGHLGATPIYTRNSQGKTVGGFNLQRFWPLPIVAMTVLATAQYSGSLINMPQWWPLIKPDLPGNPDSYVYAIFPVIAALGYGDLAVASRPEEKSRYTAAVLGIYSLSLLGLSVLASHYGYLAFVPALFGPAAHELTIILGQRRELKGEPIFVHPERGVMVLEVLPGSVAQRLHLSRGDILTNVNGQAVNDKLELRDALAANAWWTEVEYLQDRTGAVRREMVRKKVEEGMGIIPVPGPGDRPNVSFRTGGFLARAAGRLAARQRHRRDRKADL